jgi:glycosyltransferase involved in cell wall biosynthesis
VEDGEPDRPAPALPQDAVERLEDIGSADVLVGIPSIDNAETIGHVVTAVEAGLRKHLGDLDAVIVISDGGSTDGTPQIAMGAGVGDRAPALLVPSSSREPWKVTFRYGGPSGKGSALRAIFEAATRLEVRACAVVDSDLRSITPSWIDRLLNPVVQHGFEYVAPVYARHKYDGTITNSIAYPVTAALYGARIRQPIGGEFGMSGELAAAFASADIWGTDVSRFGVDIWMTTTSLVREARTCQAILGAKLHDPRDPGHLGAMLRQVVGTLFTLAERHRDRWWDLDQVADVPTFGFPADYAVEAIEVSPRRLTLQFLDGYDRHREVWEAALSAGSMAGLDAAVRSASDDSQPVVMEPDLWFRIVYDYLIAHQAGQLDRGALLDSLIPLYYARTATFVQSAYHDSDREAEARVEAGADVALSLKGYLKEHWAAVSLPRG